MAMSSARKGWAAVGLAASVSLVLAACGGDDDGDDDTAGGGDTGGGGDCAFAEDFTDLDGTSVTVYSTIVAPEDAPLEASFDAFEECTGMTVVYEGSDEFEAQLPVRIQGGSPPDLAIIPQPGLLATLVRDFDAVIEVPEDARANVEASFDPAWVDYGTVDGTYYGTPFGANVKSFVWYSPSAFADAGYEIPTTWDDLIALSDQIVADGGMPWCAGFGSGDATGWPGTDWVEEVMLRTAGIDVYRQWYNHEIPFNDPQVVEAFDTVAEILKNDQYVNGGLGDVTSIATTRFEDGGLPILDGNCWMHRQASFYQANWGEGVEVGEDGDVYAFYLPGINPEHGNPVLGGGEFVAAFTERPEVQAFQRYLTTDHFHAERASKGNFVSANRTVPVDAYDSPVNQLSAEIIADPEAVFGFDASDLMPAEVGTVAFWTGMVNWITGAETQETVDAIEDAWP
ncbi:ABC transporter substrate-binding protein [Jiangella alkaliphila]|uniref:Carbohydrate ABC transporter substrate-binding protein, CUT1 family n=1 Tax=Jiangella alkaliphila TaxID=419479 RepID=A0A1H2HWP5_9ACTN|nr:ABC transporter substrate-binding protein [Jiangella alkaliphila]SDU36343.1 carbohydrate ABC transporter substrate-binding protein, CUT1 family [Jiangella alkaliphila]